MEKFTLVYVGTRGGLHTVWGIDSFQQGGEPGQFLYCKPDKYGNRFYGVFAHTVVSIETASGDTVYRWTRENRTPEYVGVARALARHGITL